MSVRDINKLGEEINSIKNKCESDTNWFLNNLPRSIDIIKLRKKGTELINYKEYEDQKKIFEDIIKRQKRAWAEMIKLIEEFAIKEQGKKIIKKKVKKK